MIEGAGQGEDTIEIHNFICSHIEWRGGRYVTLDQEIIPT